MCLVFSTWTMQNTSEEPAGTPLNVLSLRNLPFLFSSPSLAGTAACWKAPAPAGSPQRWRRLKPQGSLCGSETSWAQGETTGLSALTNPMSGLLQGFGEPTHAPSDQSPGVGCRRGVLWPLNRSQQTGAVSPSAGLGADWIFHHLQRLSFC